ncbi:unnamed protein product [Diplocarpon coronariae]
MAGPDPQYPPRSGMTPWPADALPSFRLNGESGAAMRSHTHAHPARALEISPFQE